MSGNKRAAFEGKAKVFSIASLVEHVLGNLRQREAVQVGRTCKAFQEAVKELVRIQGFYPRLVVGSSGNHGLVEVDLRRGVVLESNPSALPTWTRKRKRLGRHERRLEQKGVYGACWLTGLAFGPHDHRLYVSQYKVHGVTVYSSKSCAAREGSVYVTDKDLAYPEGLAFAKDRLYVASAKHGTVCCVYAPSFIGKSIVLNKVSCGKNTVPWGMIAGPDGALYVAACESYKSEDYTEPPPENALGNVLRIALSRFGEFGAVTNFCAIDEGTPLRRPSGVCFDAAGRLYVTSMTGKVLRFQGPGAAEPGAFDKVVATVNGGAGEGDCMPWDVKCFQEQLIVTVHNGSKSGEGSSIMVFDPEKGERLKCITSKLLNQPNMMALE